MDRTVSTVSDSVLVLTEELQQLDLVGEGPVTSPAVLAGHVHRKCSLLTLLQRYPGTLLKCSHLMSYSKVVKTLPQR